MPQMKGLACGLLLLMALAPLVGLSFGANDWISAEASIDFATRKIFYGYALNREPIWIPHAELTFFDTLSPGVTAYCDMTDWGSERRGGPGYGDRSWRYQEIDPYVRLQHSFVTSATAHGASATAAIPRPKAGASSAAFASR